MTKKDYFNRGNELNKDRYDRISLMLPKGGRERLREYLKLTKNYNSVNSFINDLINEQMKESGYSLYWDGVSKLWEIE